MPIDSNCEDAITLSVFCKIARCLFALKYQNNTADTNSTKSIPNTADKIGNISPDPLLVPLASFPSDSKEVGIVVGVIDGDDPSSEIVAVGAEVVGEVVGLIVDNAELREGDGVGSMDDDGVGIADGDAVGRSEGAAVIQHSESLPSCR